MPVRLPLSSPTLEIVGFSLAAALAVAAVLVYRAWKRSRITPEERERRRRAALVAQGKMGDATVVEIRGDDLLFYNYAVRGVEYTASQDLSALKPYLPTELSILVGPVCVKYDAKNPANSIVLSEEWSGLRSQPRA